jgi:glycosyltransferase involved in cell wall biosynthesis
VTVVSVIVPARDEEAHIGGCVRSILRQEVEAEVEVVVADDHSRDATSELARAAGAVVVVNEHGGISAGLNRALAAARGDVIARFDAHAEMPQGYLQAALRALAEEPNASSVGGWVQADGSGPWGRATAAALESPLGVGHPLKWRRPEGTGRRDVEHVPFGCFPADRLRAVGGWRESLEANEDFELDHRLRRAGGRIVFDPAISIVYHPRESLRGLAAQYWRYGRAKAAVLADAPGSLQPRQLAPPALIATAALAAAPTPLRGPAQATIGVYGLAVAAAAARSGGGWRTAAAMVTMHVTWGAALVAGLAAAPRRRR